MRVLVACEESQRVCTAFRERGHEAYSCDIIEPSGGHPEWHILGDCIPILRGGCNIMTMDGKSHYIDKWDLLIGHPPCTYLCVSGNKHYEVALYGNKARERMKERYKAIVFFTRMMDADVERIAIENPIGIMSGAYRKPDQIIQPYEYGHPTRKSTCLWLKNLPKLTPTNIVEPVLVSYQCKNGKVATFGKGFDQAVGDDGTKYAYNDQMTGKLRSKTFPGIAKAMAEQWG